QDRSLAFDPIRMEKLVTRLAAEWRKATASGKNTALLADSSVRRPLRQALVRTLPELSVIAYQEVPADVLLEPVAMIKAEEILEAKETEGPANLASFTGLQGPTAPAATLTGAAR